MELWVEKYRPTTLEEYVGNETIKNKIADYLKQGSIQNLLFHGVAGTGKTTLAKLIAKNLNCDLLYINASDERGIDTIRDKIIPFASSMSFSGVKIVILDEADYITPQAQATLRNTIEACSNTTRFIFRSNIYVLYRIYTKYRIYKKPNYFSKYWMGRKNYRNFILAHMVSNIFILFF